MPRTPTDPLTALLVLAERHDHVMISQELDDEGQPVPGVYQINHPDDPDPFVRGDRQELADRLAEVITGPDEPHMPLGARDPDETIPPGTYYPVGADADREVLRALREQRDHDQGAPATADDLAAAAVEDYLEGGDE